MMSNEQGQIMKKYTKYHYAKKDFHSKKSFYENRCDIGHKGVIGEKVNLDVNNYDYDFGDDTGYNDYKVSDDSMMEIDTDMDDLVDDYSYNEHYENLFDTYPKKKKSNKDSKKSKSLMLDEEAGFDRVKRYYVANMEANQKKKEKMIGLAITTGLLMVGIAVVSIYATFFNMSEKSTVYIAHETGKFITSDLSVSEIHNLRQQISKDTALIVNKPLLESNKAAAKEEPKVVAPSIVNNYNFEQLNTGLTTLGYSLLGCLSAFVSFKGLSLWGRSRRLKKEIKKSNALLTQFKSLINTNNNQLETSQFISEQIILNNIFIERLSSNNNVVELIAVNEKLKDTNSFINDHLIKNLKGE